MVMTPQVRTGSIPWFSWNGIHTDDQRKQASDITHRQGWILARA
jgi:hypothetical protein